MPDVSQILLPFGFTSLESEIYAFLLSESPATGYRVAKAIGKAAANTYKGLESLQKKGAVMVEDGASRLCRAVPSDELLARLTRDFEWRRAEAEVVLAQMSSGGGDDRIYAIRSKEQVIERARHMLGSAGSVVLLACSVSIGNQIGDALAAGARRRLQIHVACPEVLGIPGIHVGVSRSVRPLDEIRLVIDGNEHLFGHFRKNQAEVAQAVWTRSAYLSVCAHRGLAAEFAQLGLKPPGVESTLGYSNLFRT